MDGARKMVLGQQYDADFIDCVRCGGSGENVECIDDICHGKGWCMHGDNTCALCQGCGVISEELRERWWAREPFESVTLPEPDKRLRGLA